MEIFSQYRFDSFAEGESTRLAFAASGAVADGNRSCGNPLVLVAATGLGKTHLLHSIANSFRAKNPGLKIVCTTALEFYEEYAAPFAHKRENPGAHDETADKLDEMSARFRSADLLLIDDFQNIERKTASQHEMLQIFNALLLAGRPIVVASQVSVSDIENLNESLRSRLTGGLSIAIPPPTFVDRLAILRKKFDIIALNIEESILLHLAQTASGSVRDLEGIVNAFSFRVTQSNKDIDLEMAEEILREHYANSHKTISMENIAKAVAHSYGMPVELLKQKSRGSKESALARQVAMHLIKSLYKSKSFEHIGKHFGRNSATVMYACNLVAKKMKEDIAFKLEVEKIKKSLYE